MKSGHWTKERPAVLRKSDLVNPFTILKILGENVLRDDAAMVLS
jgi:hypothetical protein